MRRREFMAGLAGAAAWPLAAWSQQNERVRRVGYLSGNAQNDPLSQNLQRIFWQRLSDLGWEQGRNLQIEERFAAGESARYASYAAELVGLAPDVIVANTTPAVAALQRSTDRIPIIFHQISDPVAAGFVANLAHPDSNLTGFANFEYTISGKWLQILRQAVPDTKIVGAMVDPDDPAAQRYLGALASESSRHGVQIATLAVRNADDIVRVIDRFTRNAGGGLIVFPTQLAIIHRDLITTHANQHRLPAIYGNRAYVADGGLMSYGPDRIDMLQRTAAYVDRILRGASPLELPVVQPTKFDLVINLKTAKALGLAIPETLLATADELIK
jgi:putative tryptophan/tyrosine transport system substrate-binding protein